MGTIRNRLTIVNDYNFDRITNTRQNAVEYFGKIMRDEFDFPDYDVNTQMISPILPSVVNGIYTFVIMGDCSKDGWELSNDFKKYRDEWIRKNKGLNILVADFGEGDAEAYIKEYQCPLTVNKRHIVSRFKKTSRFFSPVEVRLNWMKM